MKNDFTDNNHGPNLEPEILSTTSAAITSSSKVGFTTTFYAKYDIDDVWLFGNSLNNTTTFSMNNANDLTSATDPKNPIRYTDPLGLVIREFLCYLFGIPCDEDSGEAQAADAIEEGLEEIVPEQVMLPAELAMGAPAICGLVGNGLTCRGKEEDLCDDIDGGGGPGAQLPIPRTGEELRQAVYCKYGR